METAWILDTARAVERVSIEPTGDGFFWAETSTGKLLRLGPSEVFGSAYLAGRFAAPVHPFAWMDDDEAYEWTCSAKAWGRLEVDSDPWFVPGRAREVRAFWIGRRRSARDRMSAGR